MKFLNFFVVLCSLASATPVTVIYTANRQGEIEPCGCQVNQVGGLNRMAAFIEAERAKKTPVLVVDSGDTFFSNLSIPDTRLKMESLRAELIASSYKDMGVRFLLPGERDFSQGAEKLFQLKTQAGLKLVAANLSYSDDPAFFSKYEIVREAGHTILVTGVVDPSLYSFPGITTRAAEQALLEVLSETKALNPTSILVLSHLGSKQDEVLAAKIPGVHFLGAHSQDIYPKGLRVADSALFQPQNEGQQIGVFRLELGQPLYKEGELLGLSKDWDLKNSTSKKMQKYYSDLKKLNAERVISKTKTASAEKPYVANPFVCRTCHEKQFNFWAGTKHASAYLVLYSKNQHFDPECIGCHSLGFESPLGFDLIARPIELKTKEKKGAAPFVEQLMLKVFHNDAQKPLDSRVEPERYKKLHSAYWEEVEKAKDQMKKIFIGVQCEHCHGNRNGHPSGGVMTQKKVNLDTCVQCHRAPNAPEFDPKSITKVACPLMKG